ncbi:MAG: fused DSP-PTPase phosphatase/NAD kinase-like protein [Maricaulaceae bacterium]
MGLDLNNPQDRKQAYRDLTWGDHGFLRLRFANRHHIGGEMYRENQPSPKRIAKLAEMGTKTIINLRGESPKGFYLLEVEACKEHGIELINHRMYSRDVHTVEAIRGARDLFERIEYPAMMHCKSGADRTGIMGVLYRHFKMGDSIEEAVEQLSLKYLHVRQGKTGMLDFFFQTYLDYAKDHDISFIDWVEGPYNPPEVKANFMAGWAGSLLTEKVLKRE